MQHIGCSISNKRAQRISYTPLFLFFFSCQFFHQCIDNVAPMRFWSNTNTSRVNFFFHPHTNASYLPPTRSAVPNVNMSNSVNPSGKVYAAMLEMHYFAPREKSRSLLSAILQPKNGRLIKALSREKA